MRGSVLEELNYTNSGHCIKETAGEDWFQEWVLVTIPLRTVPGLMKDLPFKKGKLLGGKLGEEMKKRWGCTTAGEAQQIPPAALVACFGDRLGTYAWKTVHGRKAEKVPLCQCP